MISIAVIYSCIEQQNNIVETVERRRARNEGGKGSRHLKELQRMKMQLLLFLFSSPFHPLAFTYKILGATHMLRYIINDGISIFTGETSPRAIQKDNRMRG